jgi:hypothetical protein
MVFLGPFVKIPEWCFKLERERFLPHAFLLSLINRPTIPCCVARHIAGVGKQIINKRRDSTGSSKSIENAEDFDLLRYEIGE